MKQRAPKKLALAVAASLSMSGCLPAVRLRPVPAIVAVPCEAASLPLAGLPTARLSANPVPASGRSASGRSSGGRSLGGRSSVGLGSSAETPLQYPLPVTATSPFVRIVGKSAPVASYAELELLSAELHTELANRGGVRLEDSALVVRQPQEECLTASGPVRNTFGQRSADGKSDERAEIKTMSAQLIDQAEPSDHYGTAMLPSKPVQNPIQNPGGGAGPGAGPGAAAGDGVEVDVIVNDFTPYRPMQLAATFIVRDLVTGQEIHRIQRVWRGVEYEPDFAKVRQHRNSDLRHPATRPRLEYNALPDISPRHLIKRVATEVAVSLHQSVLKPKPTSGQYLSAPQGFHPQP